MIIQTHTPNAALPDISMTCYLHEYPQDVMRPAAIIVPSQYYLHHDAEKADDIAIQLLAKGFQVFILFHGIGTPFARFPFPQNQLTDAIKWVRDQSQGLSVNPSKIVVLGTGVAAHLVLSQTLMALENGQTTANYLVLGDPILDLSPPKEVHLESTYEWMYASIFGTYAPTIEQIDTWSPANHLSKLSEPALFPFVFAYETKKSTLSADSDWNPFRTYLKANTLPYSEYSYIEQLGTDHHYSEREKKYASLRAHAYFLDDFIRFFDTTS